MPKNYLKNVKAVLWNLQKGFSYAPILFILYLLFQFLRATIFVYSAVLLGDIISDVQLVLTTTHDISQVISKLILFGVLNVVLWLAVEIRWRFSDDYLPMRGAVGATRYLAKFSRLIPLRKYDDSQFCDKYLRFQNGIRSQQSFLKALGNLINLTYTLVLSLVALWRFHFLFAFICIMFYIVGIFVVLPSAGIRDKVRVETSAPQRRAGYLSEMFFGIYNRETRLYGLKDYYISKWAAAKRSVAEKEIEANKKSSLIFAISNFLYDGVAPIVVIGITLFLISKKLLLVGSIYTVWNLSSSMLSNAGDTSNVISGFIAQSKEAVETYETYCEIKKAAKPPVSIPLTPDFEAPALTVKNMDFSYIPGKKVLDQISLSIRKGEIVALLGENGSGKSTLIKLLLGVYFPENGSVSVFGNEASASEEYIREHIGIVFQDFCNYPFTLRENVGFGDIRAIEQDDRIIESMKFAHADSILQKAGRLDRMLGRSLEQDGIELSGGEWQRIALARAYMGSRDIMIFDEPAAKLDPIAEEKQFSAIMDHARNNGKTVILVSHRVGFARMADRIVFLKDGKIAETGSHAELLAQNGDYAKMFEAQRELYVLEEAKS